MKIETLEKMLEHPQQKNAKIYAEILPIFVKLFHEARKMRELFYTKKGRPRVDDIFFEFDELYRDGK